MSAAATEARVMRAIGLAALAGAGTWVFVLRAPGAALPGVAAALLWVVLAVALTLVLSRISGRGIWVFTDLLALGLPCSVAAAALDRAGHDLLTAAWLAPLALGLPGSLLALLAGRREDRHRASANRRLEADRAIARVHWRLRTGTAPVSDDDIRAALAEIEATASPDPMRRTAVLLGAVAPVLSARPALAAELLPRALRKIETASVDLDHIAAAAAAHTDERGRVWLRDVFPGVVRAR